MKIVSLIRKPIVGLTIPTAYSIGQPPQPETPGQPQQPDVAKIAYFTHQNSYPTPHYIVHFVNSTLRKRIDASEVPEIIYDLPEKKKEAGVEGPIPSGDDENEA